MTKRLSIFPLTGAVLFPGMQLPLHIFEPRYRALVGDALIRDRQIAMIQPQRPVEGAPLYRVGCVGKIGEVQAMDDGRYNLILEGTTRFRMVRELDVTTAFRQIEAEIYDEDEDETLSHAQRGGFEREARADTIGDLAVVIHPDALEGRRDVGAARVRTGLRALRDRKDGGGRQAEDGLLHGATPF